MSSPAFAIPPDLTRDTGTWPGDGPIKFGSDEHRRLFCKTLLDTHDPYRPAVLDWPKLEPEAEKRITAPGHPPGFCGSTLSPSRPGAAPSQAHGDVHAEPGPQVHRLPEPAPVFPRYVDPEAG